MHGTRTTAKILVGAALAALTGCVSVDAAPPTPPAPAPAAETLRPGRDPAPQLLEGPALEALEAALTAPPPPAAPRSSHPPVPAPEAHQREAAPTGASTTRPREPEPGQPTGTRPPLPALPSAAAGLPARPPLLRADVCALGEQYGGWAPGGAPSLLCHGTHGR
ncbi:hypothetical protein ACIOMM_05925 [Streptomyces sp. NPDC087908]|uniref:hypothetical protein n=1 Tax=Streptomyces sp. NPDC087908 TaxID=3365820 RepID=UPI0038072C6F